ncbi:MAG: DUF4062 domain-containing protein [Proteobacteria bacterium]|nr:DUF4062 domain-containing protein [Pseudomonadota bacterium]
MDKRYQIFVSSTYADLKQERQHVIQTLMEMDCIPAGMELFPAADEEQWQFIKSVIEDCDYYMLIIGGRYGSITSEGVSYTEKEYDYAIEQGLKVIALLHENPDDIPVNKSDIDPDMQTRLKAFREKVASNRLVKFWNKAEELPGLVSLSLSKTIKMFPAVGWVRASAVANEEILSELNELRKENNTLRTRIRDIEQEPVQKVEGLAGLDEHFTVHGIYYGGRHGSGNWSSTLTWREIFALVAPYLLKFPNDDFVKSVLLTALKDREGPLGTYNDLSDQDFQTISLQLKVLGLITLKYSETKKGGMGLFWSLTPQGERLMTEFRTVKSNK